MSNKLFAWDDGKLGGLGKRGVESNAGLFFTEAVIKSFFIKKRIKNYFPIEKKNIQKYSSPYLCLKA
jgi:hypothetical protein